MEPQVSSWLEAAPGQSTGPDGVKNKGGADAEFTPQSQKVDATG